MLMFEGLYTCVASHFLLFCKFIDSSLTFSLLPPFFPVLLGRVSHVCCHVPSLIRYHQEQRVGKNHCRRVSARGGTTWTRYRTHMHTYTHSQTIPFPPSIFSSNSQHTFTSYVHSLIHPNVCIAPLNVFLNVYVSLSLCVCVCVCVILRGSMLFEGTVHSHGA